MPASSFRSQVSVAGFLLTGLVFSGATACQPDGADGDYGSVRIYLQAGDNCDKCFKGTKTIWVQGAYDTCAADFYNRVPAARFIDSQGKEVVEEWTERLCAKDDPSDPGSAGAFVECKVVKDSLVQTTRDTQEGTVIEGMRFRLTATSDDLTGREIRFGPLPTKQHAKCKNGAEPKLLFGSQSVLGFDKNGEQLWAIESFDNDTLGASYNTKMLATIKKYVDPTEEK